MVRIRTIYSITTIQSYDNSSIVVLSDEFSLKIAFDKSWAIYEMGVGMLKLKHYGLKTFNVIS